VLTCVCQRLRLAELSAVSRACHSLHDACRRAWTANADAIDLSGSSLPVIRRVSALICHGLPALQQVTLPGGDVLDIIAVRALLAAPADSTPAVCQPLSSSSDTVTRSCASAIRTVTSDGWAAYCALSVALAQRYGTKPVALITSSPRCWPRARCMSPSGVHKRRSARSTVHCWSGGCCMYRRTCTAVRPQAVRVDDVRRRLDSTLTAEALAWRDGTVWAWFCCRCLDCALLVASLESFVCLIQQLSCCGTLVGQWAHQSQPVKRHASIGFGATGRASY